MSAARELAAGPKADLGADPESAAASDLGAGVGIIDALDDLAAIRRDGCAAAIWRRRVRPSVRQWLDAVDPARLPEARVIVPAHSARDAIEAACEASRLPEGLERTWLVTDMAALAHGFADLVDASHIRLRLDLVTDDGCPRFHVDTVTARLICTYRGSGTQYGASYDGETPRRVFTVPTGAPVVLRGTGWPGGPQGDAPFDLLHRSPPIEGTGETRLVLVADPVLDPDDEA